MEGHNGSEVRRLHIVYFLCPKGRIEHPHLLRVHHHSRNGVHLRGTYVVQSNLAQYLLHATNRSYDLRHQEMVGRIARKRHASIVRLVV